MVRPTLTIKVVTAIAVTGVAYTMIPDSFWEGRNNPLGAKDEPLEIQDAPQGDQVRRSAPRGVGDPDLYYKGSISKNAGPDLAMRNQSTLSNGQIFPRAVAISDPQEIKAHMIFDQGKFLIRHLSDVEKTRVRNTLGDLLEGIHSGHEIVCMTAFGGANGVGIEEGRFKEMLAAMSSELEMDVEGVNSVSHDSNDILAQARAHSLVKFAKETFPKLRNISFVIGKSVLGSHPKDSKTNLRADLSIVVLDKQDSVNQRACENG